MLLPSMLVILGGRFATRHGRFRCGLETVAAGGSSSLFAHISLTHVPWCLEFEAVSRTDKPVPNRAMTPPKDDHSLTQPVRRTFKMHV